MRRAFNALFTVICGVFVFGALGTAAAAEPDQPACLRATAEPRNVGYGYNHIVHIVSTCDVAYACDVTTDVNPEPTKALVPAKGDVLVNTYLGSSTSVYTPHLKCVKTK